MTEALDNARRTLLETVLSEHPPLTRRFNTNRPPPAASSHPDPRMHLTLSDLRLPGDDRFKTQIQKLARGG